MTVSVASVVESQNGRDKGNLLVVLKIDGEYLMLADGRRRKVEHPKKKKAKHVVDTGVKAEFDNPPTNRKIKACLKRIHSSPKSQDDGR